MSGPIPIDQSNAAATALKVKAGELPGPAKSLAEAMCRVMDRVSYVQKDKSMMGGGSYKYVSVEAIIAAIRPEMIREQLLLLPIGVEKITVEHFEGKNGGRQNRTQVIYTFKLIHAPSGQSEPVVSIGEAIDVGDKSSNKAMTAARKYALIMAFNIETGLDPDDTSSHEQERKPASQPAPKSLAQQCCEAVAAAKSRDALTPIYRQYEADAAEGRFTPAEDGAIKAAFKAASAKYPAPPKAKA